MQLFKFCQKALCHQRDGKIHDQEVGAILGYNPSDCSHWKRGEKHVKSVFSLAKIAETLGVEVSLVHDVASGAIGVDEAYYEYLEARSLKELVVFMATAPKDQMRSVRSRMEAFVAELHSQSEFSTAPLYLPEVMRFFSFINSQPVDMMDKLSRILRVKPGQYTIQLRKGDLKAQTRMSIARDLARILLDGERSRFPELGPLDSSWLAFESTVFVANLFLPKSMVLAEIAKLDSRSNIVAEIANLFWTPRSLVGFQLQDTLRSDLTQLASINKSVPAAAPVIDQAI
jgi:hypothetical protein